MFLSTQLNSYQCVVETTIKFNTGSDFYLTDEITSEIV